MEQIQDSKPTKYLLTVMIQRENKIFTSNVITEMSPELWLIRMIRKNENDRDYNVVIINSIILKEYNNLALKKK